MSRRMRCVPAFVLAGLFPVFVGCAGGPNISNSAECSQIGCPDGECVDGGHGCQPPDRWSEEWYALKATEPVGARQRCYKGKVWPPRPRPVGPQQQFSHRYHAAHYWPWPYNCQGRAYVRNVVSNQVANGWTTETTLYDYHFEEDTQELTHAGRSHLAWILREIPPQRRVAFVQTVLDPSVNEVRMQNVQLAAHEMVGEEHCPPIVPRVTSPVGTPAEYTDAIQRAIRDSIPEPRIQFNPNPTGVGTGG